MMLFGGTGGIGRKLLSLLLDNGFFVTLAVRNVPHAKSMFRQYLDDGLNQIEFVDVNLEREQSVKYFLERFHIEKLDAIIFASGVRGSSSSMGIKPDFEVNYVAPLTIGIHFLEKFPALRLINISSSAAFRFNLDSPKSLFVKGPSSFGGDYARSKLALTLASYSLSQMFPASHIISVDPGSNRTQMTLSRTAPLILRFAAAFFSNPNVGAKRIMNAFLNKEVPSGTHINANGKYRNLTHYRDAVKYVHSEIRNGYPYMPR